MIQRLYIAGTDTMLRLMMRNMISRALMMILTALVTVDSGLDLGGLWTRIRKMMMMARIVGGGRWRILRWMVLLFNGYLLINNVWSRISNIQLQYIYLIRNNY